MKTPHWLILHHTGGTKTDPRADTSHHTFEDVNAWHKQDENVWLGELSSLGYSCGYTYYIDKKGKVTQARADGEQAAHCKGYNNNDWDIEANASIGICLAGNFDVTFPTSEQIKSLELLLLRLTTKYSIPKEKIVAHRKFASKTCFGRNLPDDWGQTLLKPVVITPEENMCIAQEKVIEEQKKQIGRLQQLVQDFLTYIRSRF